MVHAMGISTARVRFLREQRRGNKGEERGSARRGRRAGGRVTKRRKKGERRGGPVRGTRRESREPTGCWEKEKRTVHKDAECGIMLWPRENRVLPILTQAAFAGHAAK